MSDFVGHLVADNETGLLAEGKNHAAKVFEDLYEAKAACGAMSKRTASRLTYAELAKSLRGGSAFCFDTEYGHQRFLRRLRNDMPNKAMLAKSQDRNFISWRNDEKPAPPQTHPDPGVADNPGIPAVPAAQAPVEGSGFNPAILVRKGD